MPNRQDPLIEQARQLIDRVRESLLLSDAHLRKLRSNLEQLQETVDQLERERRQLKQAE